METNNLTDGLSYHNQVTAKIKDDLGLALIWFALHE